MRSGHQHASFVKYLAGVLEWVDGTVPLGKWLTASDTGAHERYRPQDSKASTCRKMMKDACMSSTTQEEQDNPMSKLNVFLRIQDQFKPVFRCVGACSIFFFSKCVSHFFTEHFPTPDEWFERRLAYTRSTAASSIVGFALGLGDRHLFNILVDEQTAELVHIDLGLAFDQVTNFAAAAALDCSLQAKLLKIPETIPFRLTRDIVDGFGVAGVEGVFRNCCERTLAVLRKSQVQRRQGLPKSSMEARSGRC